MKFELEPDNRGAEDETLLRNLREVASALGKDYVTKEEYEKHGRWCPGTLQKRFGSWCKAHEFAGLRRIRNYDASREDCVKDLVRVAMKLGTKSLSISHYRPHGKFSDVLIQRRCGSWNEALQQAGLTSPQPYTAGIPKEDLFKNLENVWESLGRQPRISDFRKPLSKYSHASYSTRFGSFRKALEAFVDSLDEQDEEESQVPEAEPDSGQSSVSHGIRHRTSRKVSW
jgi:Homing endonuclease associated repeat